MCLGLAADALQQSLNNDTWRYLRFLEVGDVVSAPQPLLELFSILLIVVISDIRPTPALHSRLQALVSMATSSVTSPSLVAENSANGDGPNGADQVDGSFGGTGDGLEASLKQSQLDCAHAAAARTLADIFAQAVPAGAGSGAKPWDHLRQLVVARNSTVEAYGGAASGGGAPPRSSAMHFSKFLSRIRGGKPLAGDESVQAGARGALDALEE